MSVDILKLLNQFCNEGDEINFLTRDFKILNDTLKIYLKEENDGVNRNTQDCM
jgi:hypothetical protein